MRERNNQPSARPPDVLLDDDPVSRRGVCRILGRFCEVREVGGINDALLAMELRVPDLVLTGWEIPDGGGRRLLALLAERYSNVIRVVLTGETGLTAAR